jgi:hypothetical protein
MPILIPAEGAILERILHTAYSVWPESLSRSAFTSFQAAHTKTAWALRHQRRYALVEGGEVLASAQRYDLAGILDRQPMRVCGIGDLLADPASSESSHTRVLVEQLLDAAERDGADIALLFVTPGSTSYVPDGFEAVPMLDVELRVTESSRHGAPMTLVRGGEDRDLAAIVSMGQVRGGQFRFHLDRDADFVKHEITKKRLLAGLAPSGTRELQFVIAEEGITAAAYVVISIVGHTWTLQECGDRDPSGARVGALLQALIAREPVEQRPTIRAWLPSGFVPPQVTILSARSSAEVMMVRLLRSAIGRSALSSEDVLYWRGDIF